MAIRLNGVFKDNMIFQQNKEIRVFGDVSTDTAANDIIAILMDSEGEFIRNSSADEVYEDGFFLITMESLPAGGPYYLEVFENGELTNRINDIYIGELWLASGQSNMEYPLGRTEGAKYLLPKIGDTNIHFYNIPAFGEYSEEQRKAEDESTWTLINRDTCYGMSGIAYFFAKKLEEFWANDEANKNVHIGIIGCYVGATSVACWQSVDALNSTKEGKAYIADYLAECDNKPKGAYEAELASFNKRLLSYNSKVEHYLKTNPYATYHEVDKVVGSGPWPHPVGRESMRRPGALFDTMVLRVVPLAIKGVIFYQGEEDAEDYCNEYGAMFKSLIKEWREAFWEADLPFIFCQLPMYISKDRKFMGYDDMHWPRLREQQMRVQREVENTYIAILTDCGEFDNIHPADKKTPGERLANLALRFVYNQEDVPAVAPYIVDVRRGEGVEISFAGDFGSLKLVSGLAADESGFEVAGENCDFYKAEAEVDFDGKTIILNCPQVELPMRVRYAYFSYGQATLAGDTGLAAAPFDTSIEKAISNFY